VYGLGDSVPAEALDRLRGLQVLEVPASLAATGAVAPGRLRLRRAWPRTLQRLRIELVDGRDRVVAGQWYGEPDAGPRLDRVARRTARTASHPGLVAVDREQGVLLQAGGADRRLPGLRQVVSRPDAELVAHRAEQRAVVRLPAGAGPASYVKAVRPGRTRPLVEAAEVVLPVRTPRLLRHDDALGVVEVTAVPGDPLRKMLSGAAATQSVEAVAREVARRLRAVHRCTPPAQRPARDVTREVGWVATCVDRLTPYAPSLQQRASAVLPHFARLLDEPAQALVLVHGDLHDGQVIVDADGVVGIVDWDRMGGGEGALDLAGLVAHVRLRVLEGTCKSAVADAFEAALLNAYGATARTRARTEAYVGLLNVRMACQQAFRLRGLSVAARLLAARILWEAGTGPVDARG
jgi:aminoglycoside phosphotransferase (APT) family kinase protein